MAGGPEESDRRPLDAITMEAIAELRRLFRADVPASEAGEEAAQELVAAAGRVARTAARDNPAFEPLDAVEALLRAQASPAGPAAFSLDGLAPPGATRGAGPAAARAAPQRGLASDLLAAAAEQRGMEEAELVAYLEAIGPNAALLAELRSIVLTLDRASARALLALLAAIATLTRELSDGALRKTLHALGIARTDEADDRPHPRIRRRLRL